MPTVTKNRVRNMWVDSERIESNGSPDVEKRYNRRIGVLFIAEDDVIRTVLNTSYLNVYSSGERCDWCGKSLSNRESCRKCNGWKFD